MKPSRKKFSSRNLLLALGGLLLILVSFDVFTGMGVNRNHITYSDLISQINQGQVKEVVIEGRSIEGYTKDGRTFTSYMPLGSEGLVNMLSEKGVKVDAKEPSNGSSIVGMLLSWLPMLFLIGLWIFSMRSMQKGGGPLGFSKSRVKEMAEAKEKVYFKDVGGVSEARDQVAEIVDFLSNPRKFGSLGGRIPRGCLLVGPPGTGKTLLAKAVAGEAGVPFFSVSGSEFVEMFVGVGASRVRDMFAQARQKAPCLLFIDEIDAVGKQRGGVSGMSQNDEREQTLNQLLVEMDGMNPTEGVIVIAATNREDVLDKALLRPGRFDRVVHVGLPDIMGREEILNIHVNLKKVPLAKDVEINTVARGTTGFSGADLANIVNEAALMAAGEGGKSISMIHLEEARDKVLMGVERRSMRLSKEDKELIAYHEAGHALVALRTKGAEPVHKATIIPRGKALGLVMQLPERDRFSMPLHKLHASLDVAMGGRVAEELVLGKDNITTGAVSDIQGATSMARSMVTQWGLSKKLGPVYYRGEDGFFGSRISDSTSKLIDDEVRDLLSAAYKRAHALITKNRKELDIIAQALLKHETLLGSELEDILRGKRIIPKSKKRPPPRPSTQGAKPAAKRSQKKRSGSEAAEGLVPAI